MFEIKCIQTNIAISKAFDLVNHEILFKKLLPFRLSGL